MSTIKAPYNFVPLSDKVYFPDWADKVSQDIPFEDGESGTIEFRITAQTPIFVRNGHTKEDAEKKMINPEVRDEAYKNFSKVGEEYFIPSTSIKGCIRNVLEIMSLGKMRLDKNAKFAQREWNDESLYPLKKEQRSFHCGWLKPKGDDYVIEDCGTPMRIGHERIDNLLGFDYSRNEDGVFWNKFSQRSKFDITKETKIGDEKYDPKTAVYKYKLLQSEGFDLSILEDLNFSKDSKYYEVLPKVGPNNRYDVADGEGEFSGTIVLTGQPDKWMYPRPTKLTPKAGKFYEFVFRDEIIKTHTLSAEEFEHYKFIYKDSPDWKFAQTRLNGKGIPIFFRLENEMVKDFGLAYLYKLPYSNTPYDTLSSNHKDEDKMDLADCIFGRISGDSDALKGRVQFSSAFSKNATLAENVRLALGSPKASYYPMYIQQSANEKYNTYNDGKISGWKRYVVRRQEFGNGTGFDNIDTFIYPLDRGSVFEGKIKFHNLRKVELGALLSAITFHNSSDCYHQIGQGKPYGFGKVSIDINSVKNRENKELDGKQYMIAFEGALYEYLKKSWVDMSQIVELFTLAHEEVTDNDVFDYLRLNVEDPSNNEFVAAKAAKEYLNVYSKLASRVYKPESLYEPIKDQIKETEEERYRLSQKFVGLVEKETICRNLVDSKSYKDAKQSIEALLKDLKEVVFVEKCSKYDDFSQKRLSLVDKLETVLRIDVDPNITDQSSISFADYIADADKFQKLKNKLTPQKKELYQPIERVEVDFFNKLKSMKPLMKSQELKEIRKFASWKKISEFFGESKAKEWFDELNK